MLRDAIMRDRQLSTTGMLIVIIALIPQCRWGGANWFTDRLSQGGRAAVAALMLNLLDNDTR